MSKLLHPIALESVDIIRYNEYELLKSSLKQSDHPLLKYCSPATIDTLARIIESSCNSSNIDKAIENNIPQFWNDTTFVEQYSNIVYAVAVNLFPTSSVNKSQPPHIQNHLIRKVLLYGISLQIANHQSILTSLPLKSRTAIISSLQQIDLKKIGDATSDELNPYINNPYKEIIKYRSEQTLEIKTSQMYECNKCKKRETKCYQLQTRSSDEGYTQFIECQVCFNKWTLR